MTVDAFPLRWPTGWPRTAPGKRGRAGFKVSADTVRRELFGELRALGARDVVVSSNVPLRQDGTPMADVMRNAMADPGVASGADDFELEIGLPNGHKRRERVHVTVTKSSSAGEGI
jgi:hypothetical protein